MELPDLLVTNFKRRITGVSSTAVNVTAAMVGMTNRTVGICGPGQGLRLWQALRFGWRRPADGRKRIWHVRRNSEMLWGLIARDILRQPVRLVFTSAAIRQHSALPRWLISKMDALVATSPQAAAFLPRVDLVQGHGVDTAVFRPAKKKTAAVSMVSIGRIRPEKGTHILVAALAAVLPEFPDVTMHFIGQARAKDQAFLGEQKAMLSTAGVSCQVVWHGEMAPSRVAERLAAAHILAATPLYEGYGLTPFEGMSAGCCLLVSDTGAYAQAVGAGETGLLVPLNDIPATIEALQTLLSDEALRQEFQAAARARIQAHFSIEREAAALLTLYEGVR